ncbi:MAG: mycothiol system anti-sigma-R factor [Nakamurella sp.]
MSDHEPSDHAPSNQAPSNHPHGGPAETECEAVLRDVWVFLDNELDPYRREVVERHLIDCPPCLDETDLGHRLKGLLHRTCGGDIAPAALRAKLVAAMTARTDGPSAGLSA